MPDLFASPSNGEPRFFKDVYEDGHAHHRRLTMETVEKLRACGDLSEEAYRKFMESTSSTDTGNDPAEQA